MENYIKELSVSQFVNSKALKSYTAKIDKIEEIVPETFQFDFILDSEIDFLPGQYIWLQLKNLIEPDPRGEQRAFSIISGSSDKRKISIVFRRSESGFKKTLLSLKPGSEVNIQGPRGFFTLATVKSPTVLIAGGVGIAPFISMLEYLSNINSPRKTLLFINNISNDRRVYSEEIQKIVKSNPNLRVYELIGETLNWGFISKNLEESDISVNDAVWYLSGPEDMIDTTYSTLESQNINPDKIMLDEFKPNKGQYLEKKDILTNEQGSFYKLASDEFSVHIAITDPEGRILYANQAAEQSTGYKLSEMLGGTPRLWGGLMNKEFYENMWNTIKNDRKTFSSEILNRRKNGELYVSRLNISPLVENRKLLGYIATEFEITDIIKRNSSLVEKIAEYEKLNKLMVDREIRMVELKNEIAELKAKQSN